MADILEKLSLCDLLASICLRWVRLYGHVMRLKEKEINRVRSLPKPGKLNIGRPKKTWDKCISDDLEVVKLKRSDALDRDRWSESLRNYRLEHTPSSGSAPPTHG